MTLSRRQVLAMSLEGLLGASLLSCSKSVPAYKISFERAKADPATRQAFLDERKTSFERPYVRAVTYDAQGDGETGAVTGPCERGTKGKRHVYDVRVFPRSFEMMESEAEFLCAIIDHEIEGHARVFHFGSPDYPESAFQLPNGRYHEAMIPVYELIAYRQHWLLAEQRGLSPDAKSRIMLLKWRYYNELSQHDVSRIRDPSIMLKAQVDFLERQFNTATINGKRMLDAKPGHFLILRPDLTYQELDHRICEAMAERIRAKRW